MEKDKSTKQKFISTIYWPYRVHSNVLRGEKPTTSPIYVLIPLGVYKVIGFKQFEEVLRKFPIYFYDETTHKFAPNQLENVALANDMGNITVLHYESATNYRINYLLTPLDKWEELPTYIFNSVFTDEDITKNAIALVKEEILNRVDADP